MTDRDTLQYVRGRRRDALLSPDSAYRRGVLAAYDDLIEYLEEALELADEPD